MKPIEYYIEHPDDPDAPESIRIAHRSQIERAHLRKQSAHKRHLLQWFSDNLVALLALIVAIIALLKP